MTGQPFLARAGRPRIPHEHVVFGLDERSALRFADTRWFAWWSRSITAG
jgi:formamidopyrimidine-DNA glycosylase